MEDSTKNLDILRRVSGVEIGSLWLLHDESFKEFFDWFGKSVSDDNLASDSLLREYADLERNDLVLSEGEVEAEIEVLCKDFPGILEYNDDDVEIYEEQLEELVAIEEQYEKFIADAKQTEKGLTKELSELDMQLIDAEFHQGKTATECMEKAKFIEEIQSNSQQQIFDMHQCYVQAQNPPLFVYQMPIEQFSMKCDQFLKYLEMYIRKHFSVRNLDDSEREPDQNQRDIIVQLESIKSRLDVEEVKLTDASKEFQGLKRMMERFQDLSWQPMKIEVMRRHCSELKFANEQDTLRIDVLKQELEMYIRQMNEHRIEYILYENSKLKLERAIGRLEYIKKLAEIVSSSLMNAEMLWILMQLDLEKMKNKFDNSDDMNAETQLCLKRIEAMRALERNNAEEEALEEFSSQIGAVMGALNLSHSASSSSSSVDRSLSLKNSLQDFVDFRKRAFKTLTSIVNGKFYKNMDDLIKELNENEKALNKYVFDGPVNRPQFFDQQYQERMQRLSFEMDQIDKDLRALKTDYQQNINEPKNNKFWRYNQNLWVWFLTEPKKVAVAIKEVTAAASQMAAYKSISGLKCKSIADEMKF
ncbi:augmin complex subunit dgt3 [Aedes albopictus]|uniref:HAUS augmin-like complex subunit 3 N-terminal domain-containing protein n=1 Tax=Aedes albopictus TaxID=7160 RepID=A0ABM1XVA9_AEDAL|nr:augmin complex subunit dgt3 [Aedes albopictus]XP_029714883.1 augmin complex subunit dgt3 [Aedes albopictus]